MNSKQRSSFRKECHNFHPLVTIGNLGLDQRIVKALDQELSLKEIVKVKFLFHKDEKRSLSESLAEQTHSELVAIIGNIAIFYRDSDNHLYKHLLK